MQYSLKALRIEIIFRIEVRKVNRLLDWYFYPDTDIEKAIKRTREVHTENERLSPRNRTVEQSLQKLRKREATLTDIERLIKNGYKDEVRQSFTPENGYYGGTGWLTNYEREEV